MISEIASAATAFATAFAVGMFVPAVSDWLLRRKWNAHCSWWYECCCDYQKWLAGHEGQQPLSTASGEEGALGMWLKDSLRLARFGKLTKEQAAALRKTGVSLG